MEHNIRYLHGVDPKTIQQPPKPPAQTAHVIPKPAEIVQQQGIRVFRVLLEAFVIKSDDTLFQMAQNASVDQDQHAYFSALRFLRLNKPLLVQRFEKGYEQAFYDFFAPPIATDSAGLASATLSIVDKEVLEIDLAGEMMAKRVKQKCETGALNLQARLESVCTYACRGTVMPFEPLSITLIFKQLLQAFELDTKSKLVLLKEFERGVLKHLPELIESANQLLIKMGILPTLNMRPEHMGAHRARVSVPAVAASATHTPAVPSAQAGFAAPYAGSNGLSAVAAPASYQQSLYQNFEQWLAAQSIDNLVSGASFANSSFTNSSFTNANSGASTAAGTQRFSGLTLPYNPVGVKLHAPQLTPLLTQLQQQLLQNQAQLTPAFLDEAITHPAGLTRYVHQQLHQHYQQGYQLDYREHNILALLTQVFSQVLEQQSLPKLVRYALWRLQIPYLKVALQDTHFFIDAHHPARELLNLLAESALKIDLTQACNDPLLDQIDVVVKRVLQEYDQDLGLFNTLIAEFRGFLELHKRRMQLLQQRLQAAEEGKARRETAEQEVNQCLQRLLTAEVPEVVRDFAQQWWWKVLFYLYLKEGTDSDAWRRAHQCLQNLMVTVLPKASSIDVEIAKQALPDLIQQLREGLQWVGCEDAEIKQIIKPLRLIHSVGIIQKKSPVAVAPQKEMEMPPADVEIPILSPLPEDASFLNPAILVGEWIEYVKRADEVIRCQLVMHLPSCDKMIFINRIGMKVLECKGSEFREKLASGECRKLQQSALFDQALRQVIELMQTDQSKSWKMA